MNRGNIAGGGKLGSALILGTLGIEACDVANEDCDTFVVGISALKEALGLVENLGELSRLLCSAHLMFGNTAFALGEDGSALHLVERLGYSGCRGLVDPGLLLVELALSDSEPVLAPGEDDSALHKFKRLGYRGLFDHGDAGLFLLKLGLPDGELVLALSEDGSAFHKFKRLGCGGLLDLGDAGLLRVELGLPDGELVQAFGDMVAESQDHGWGLPFRTVSLVGALQPVERLTGEKALLCW